MTGTKGEIVLGRVEKRWVRFPFRAFSHHAVIVSATGGGKTFLIIGLILQVLALLAKPAIWIHDYIKNEFISLIKLKADPPFLVVNSKSLFVNILEPPEGVARHVWGERILEVLAYTLDLKEPTLLAVRRTLHRLYDHGIPTLANLAEAVQKEEDLNEAIKSNFVSKIEGLAAAVPSMYRTRRGLPSHRLEQLNLIWDLHDIGVEIQNLIVAWSRAAAFCRRVESRVQLAEPDLLIWDDEAWRHYNPGADGSYLSQLASVARSTGIGLALANQTSDLSRNVLSNAGTKILGVVGHGRDIEAMGAAMNLSTRQKRWVMQHLSTAHFVAKLSHGKYRDAFPFRAPDVRPLPLPTREEVDQAAQRLLDDLLPPQEATPSPAVTNHTNDGESRSDASADARLLLEAVQERPFMFLTHYYISSGLGYRRGNDAKNEILENGLAAEHVVELGRTGRYPRTLELSARGYRLLGKEAAPELSDGFFLRSFGRHHVAAALKQEGYALDPIPDGCDADLLARRAGERTVILFCSIPLGLMSRMSSIPKSLFDRAEVQCFTTPCLRKVEEMLRHKAQWSVHHIHYIPLEVNEFH